MERWSVGRGGEEKEERERERGKSTFKSIAFALFDGQAATFISGGEVDE